MRRLSTFVLKHKLMVILFWLAATIGGGMASSVVPDRLVDDYSFPDEPSYQASAAITRTYGNGGATEPLAPVIVLPSGTTADSPAVSQGLRSAAAELSASARIRMLSYADTGDRRLVSSDGTTMVALAFPPGSWGGKGKIEKTVSDVLQRALPSGSKVDLAGLGVLEDQIEGGASGGVVAETLIGGLGALIVLAWVFGSLLALLPLIIAAVSILVTFLMVLGLTQITDINSTIQYLVALIGLGVAVDYSLLLVKRWREERSAGADPEEAIHRAMRTAGRTVVFSGLTVAVSLGTMMVLPVPYIRSIGYGSMLIPLVSTVVTLTLVPVLLRTIGMRLEWPRLHKSESVGKVWTRWAGVVTRHPVIALVVGLLILAPLTAAAFTIKLGDPPSSSLPANGSAGEALARLDSNGIPRGVMTPIEVLVPRGTDPQSVANRLGNVPGVFTASAPDLPEWRRDGTALVEVLPVAETSTPDGETTVRLVRDAVAELPPGVQVGGRGALTLDAAEALYDQVPIMIIVVLVLTFILLARVFRSVLLALQAIVLNAISIGAAFGLLVLIWQEGHGSGLIWGIDATGAIALWVPLVVLAFLFGLSMDYEVFLLSRMREEYDVSGSTHAAISTGLGRVGRLVTSAALILFLAFVMLAALPVVDLKIAATGLGAGILLDATILRALLVPALVALTGERTWWMPKWLGKVLFISARETAVHRRLDQERERAQR